MIPQEQNSFDMIAACGRAYMVVWAERRYLMALLLGPIIIKLACYTAALSLGYEDNIARLTLILLPALFAEGWMLAHFTRLLVFNQRWPFKPSGDEESDMAALEDRMRGILPGMIVYVLINIVLGAIFALVAAYAFPDMSEPVSPEDLPPGAPILMISMIVALVLAFRLLWLYIPLATRSSADEFLKSFAGGKNLLALLGLWLLCSVPAFVAVQVGGAFILTLTGEGAVGAYLLVILKVLADSIKNIICTAGVVYAWRELVTGKVQ